MLECGLEEGGGGALITNHIPMMGLNDQSHSRVSFFILKKVRNRMYQTTFTV